MPKPQPESPAPTESTEAQPPPVKRPQFRNIEVYGEQLDHLQGEVNALKDRIYRSKARLSLIKETVLRSVMAGSRVILAHRNVMGSTFRLVRIVYVMDGVQLYARTDPRGGLDAEDELVIYDGNLPPGPHSVTIALTYKGHGYGIFKYLADMTFESRSAHVFSVPKNAALKLTSVGFEAGNLTTQMRDRPKIDWQDAAIDARGRLLSRAPDPVRGVVGGKTSRAKRR